MSAEKLINIMEKLLKLHKSLYELALKKTDIVKNGDINALNQSLKDEQVHIAAINKLEKERQMIAAAMIPGVEQPTLIHCINVLEETDQIKLGDLRSELFKLIEQIQQRNELNQQMIYQSLQFVNFSLNLILPQQGNINYGPNGGVTNTNSLSKGLFNSKA